MEIRELTAADRQSAIELWEQAGLTRPWNPPGDDFDRAVAGSTSTVLGLLHEGTLKATVMVGHDGHRGSVYYLAVDPGRRRSGLGRAIMDAAEHWLRQRGVVKLNVMVRNTNGETLELYERLGYDDADVVVLARWLTRPTEE